MSTFDANDRPIDRPVNRPVNRCVCHDVPFARVLALRDELDPDRRVREDEMLRIIHRRTGAGTGCTTCRPYLRLCLRTGETAFAVLTAEQCARLASEPTPDD